jgi:hypothetical protein
MKRNLIIAAAALAIAVCQAGVASADYDPGHWASGIMYCGLRAANGTYPIGTTAPVMVPDVAGQRMAFRDELWTNAGGRWHVVIQSPLLSKTAPSDIFSAGLQTQFESQAWTAANGAQTTGYRLYSVRPGNASWAILQRMYWFPATTTVDYTNDQSLDIFSRATTTGTVVVQAHSRSTWANESSLGGSATSHCELTGGRFI